MKEAIFYRLYMQRKADPEKFLAVFEFMGEVYIEPLQKWGYVSHECSARTSELNQANPGLLERKYVTGKSGARYYVYRIHPQVTAFHIKDPALLHFYKAIKARGA